MRYLPFFLVALLVMGASHRYVWARLVRDASLPAPWNRIATIAIIALYVLLMGSVMVARSLPRAFASPLLWVTYSWLGLLFFLVMALAFTDVMRVVTMRVQGSIDDPERRQALSRLFGGVAALLGIGASAVGVVTVLAPVAVSHVRVAIDRLSKASSGMRIVQLTDVHVGPTIGKGFIESVVARVNALDADVIVITGDLVDGSVKELAEHVAPLAKLKAKHGVFFVTGNHEYYSGAEEWIRHVGTLGIRVLRNERVRIGGEEGFDLAGVDDHSAKTSDVAAALAGRETHIPVVLLAHQPKSIDHAVANGVDLQLSGHTHGGQLFPWNFMVRLQQPFVAGLHKVGRTQIYVSRGTGYWGPPMRVGAPPEIAEIELVTSS